MAFSKGAGVNQQRNVFPSSKWVVKTARWAHSVLEIKNVAHKRGVAGFAICTKPIILFKRDGSPSQKGA
jgi:hypothetical protein